MPGVEVVEEAAFHKCWALTDVECGKLENIGHQAFYLCPLGSIDLTSAKFVEEDAFCNTALTEATFGSKLERIERRAFAGCPLERITIPLKDGIITRANIFAGCDNLKHVDLVEGPIHETIAALQLEEWRNEMNEEIDSINQILTDASACSGRDDNGENARAIGTWIRSVLHKITRYRAKHQRCLNEAATTLPPALPRDIVMNNVLPFLELPYTRLKKRKRSSIVLTFSMMVKTIR